MSVKVKIVVTMINLACLLATLAFPNDMTPFAVMITIVSLSTWAFHTYEDQASPNLGLISYIVAVSLTAMVCVILGICANIKMVDANSNVLTELGTSFDHYVFCIKQGAFVLSGEKLNYTIIAMVAFVIISILSTLEIIATARENRTNATLVTTAQSEPITVMIEKQIGYLR